MDNVDAASSDLSTPGARFKWQNHKTCGFLQMVTYSNTRRSGQC
jgi:hypothetical protein